MVFRILLLITALHITCISAFPVNAQNQTPVVIGMLPFSYNNKNFTKEEANSLNQRITQNLKLSQRIKIIDQSFRKNNKQSYQKDEILEYGTQQGVGYLMSINYQDIERGTYKKTGYSSPSPIDFFDSHLIINVKIYDVSTGELKANKILFNSSEDVNLYNIYTQSSPDVERVELEKMGFGKSDLACYSMTVKNIEQFLNDLFPISVRIKQILEQSEKGISKVLLDGGTDNGIKADSYYYLYTNKEYKDSEKRIFRRVCLAQCYNVKNLSATSGELNVWSGKRALKSAFDEGAPIYCSPEGTGITFNPKQKNTIAISPFAKKGNVTSSELSWLEQFITNCVLEQGRFKVVERSSLVKLMDEKETQKAENFIDPAIIDQGKGLGADFIMFGEAYFFETWYHRNVNSDGPKSGFYTNLRAGIKLVNVATGQVEAEKIISVLQHTNGITDEGYENSAKSQLVALAILNQKINRLFLQTFPLDLEILEVSDISKKGVAEKVILNCGRGCGLHLRTTTSTVKALNGTPFEVFEVSEEDVDGQKLERSIKIGEILVKDVENELITECKVRSGGDKIQANFISGTRMICRIKRSTISD